MKQIITNLLNIMLGAISCWIYGSAERPAMNEGAINKALKLYRMHKNLGEREILTPEQVDEAVWQYRRMEEICSQDLINSASKAPHNAENIRQWAQYCREVYGFVGNEDMEVIAIAVKKWISEVDASDIHKGQYDMIKSSTLEDFVIDRKGRVIFDSSLAHKVTSKQVIAIRSKDKKIVRKIRIVSTSENGVTREAGEFISACEALGHKELPLMAKMEVPVPDRELNKQEKEEFIEHYKLLRHKMYADGVTDIATGIHYMFTLRGASMTRKANVLFMPGLANWDEVCHLWYHVIKCRDAKGFHEAFGYAVNMSKIFTRMSSRGASSYSVAETCKDSRVLDFLTNLKELKVLDQDAYVDCIWKQHCNEEELDEIRKNPDYEILEIDGPRLAHVTSIQDEKMFLVTIKGKRKLTCPDGQALMRPEVALAIGYAVNILNMIQYLDCLYAWSDHVSKGGTLADAPTKIINVLAKVSNFQFRHLSKKGMIWIADFDACKATKTYREVCAKMPEDVDPDSIVDLTKFDLVFPQSVVKFNDGPWNSAPLEICAWAKPGKNQYVKLNTQFVNALYWPGHPSRLLEIVKRRIDLLKAAATDVDKAMEFHKVFGGTDDEGNGTTKTYLVDILKHCNKLFNEPYVISLRAKTFIKAMTDLRLCKIPVPGVYGYMVADPNGQLNLTFGSDLACLPSGTSYFNGKNCEAGFFRTPLVHPNEVVKTQLIDMKGYSIYRDCAVFNIFDCSWDNLGGGDTDGDKCAIIPADTEDGAIIVDGIRNSGYIVTSSSKSPVKVDLDLENDFEESIKKIVKFLEDNSQSDRTGLITNYASCAMEMSNHLLAIADWCELKGIKAYFKHPKSYGKDKRWGAFEMPHEVQMGDHTVLECKGLVEAKWDSMAKAYHFDEDSEYSLLGECDVKHIRDAAAYLLHTVVAILRTNQGDEIDGAKTGWYPTLIDETLVTLIGTNTLLYRQQVVKGATDEEIQRRYINAYMSIAPAGIVARHVSKIQQEDMENEFNRNYKWMYKAINNGESYTAPLNNIKAILNLTDEEWNELSKEGKSSNKLSMIRTLHTKRLNWYNAIVQGTCWSSKTMYLRSLLTDEEWHAINDKRDWIKPNGEILNVSPIEAMRGVGREGSEGFIKGVVSFFRQEIKDYMDTKKMVEMKDTDTDDGDDAREEALGVITIEEIKEKWRGRIIDAAFRNGLSVKLIAAACYFANYAKDTDMEKGNSFAWLFFDEILSLFSRGEHEQLIRCPESGSLMIYGEIMYRDGKPYKNINRAAECDECERVVINGKTYAKVVIRAEEPEDRETEKITAGKTYCGLKLYGFGKRQVTSEEVFDIITNNIVTISMVKDSADIGMAVLKFKDKELGILNIGKSLDTIHSLMEHDVQVVNTPKVNASSITGIDVNIVS